MFTGLKPGFSGLDAGISRLETGKRWFETVDVGLDRRTRRNGHFCSACHAWSSGNQAERGGLTPMFSGLRPGFSGLDAGTSRFEAGKRWFETDKRGFSFVDFVMRRTFLNVSDVVTIVSGEQRIELSVANK